MRGTQGFNATLYQLEPDVKEAPGALRDLTAARTIAMLTDPLLLRRGPADPARVDQAEDFLLRVRSTLHLNAGRNQNTLSHEMQERTAELLGYPGAEPRQRVERLMSDYFRHARTAHRSLSWARKGAPVPVGPNLGISRDGIRFLDPIQAARNPATWIGAFQAAIEADTTVSEEALSCIQQHVDRFRADDFFPDRQRSLALLHSAQAEQGTLRPAVGDARLRAAGRVFPEFQAISWRVVRDFYHKYTVDEHTLLTIRNLERISTTEMPYRLRFRNVLGEIDRPELLVLSLLLHDVGKWRDDDHAIESVRMAVEAVERLELDNEAREDGPLPDSPSPPDVARRFPARHRGSRHRQGLLGVHRQRRAAQDAHADDAGGRRSGQPGDVDGVEGGAALAALRGHLQSPDAALRR